MAWYRKLRMIPKIVLPVGLMLIVALGLLTWQIQSRSSEALRTLAERELAALAGENGNAVKSIFELALNESGALANSLTSALTQGTVPSREEIVAMLTGMQAGNSQSMGAGCAFEPDAYDGQDASYKNILGGDSAGRFIPYIAEGEGVAPLQDLEESAYYAEPKKRNNAFLTEPYEYEVGGKKILMLTGSAPVKVSGRFKGIVLVDMSIAKVSEIVRSVKVYTSGRAALLTQNGLIVAHPDPKMVMTNLIDTGRVADGKAMRSAMQAGKPYTEIYNSGGRDNIYYYFPIYFDATGQTWYFGVAAPLEEVMAEADAITAVTLILCLSTLLLSLAVIFLVVRASLRPLGVLAGAAAAIASGNLKVEIHDQNFGGEMLELSTSLKNMITSLLELISKAEAMSEDAKAQTIKAREATKEAEEARLAAENAKREGMLQAAGHLEDVVHVISSASEELSAQVEQSERGSATQAARVAETATAMEEMNSTVLEVARSAGAASELSGDTRARAEDGAKIVRDAVTGIRSVQEVSLQLKDDMNTLSGQAESISAIIGVISDIADQTNLLALNAAIEAARAGDAGRGFAVVADEVRKLAEKTMISTKDVGDAISAIQGSVRQSITQVDKAVSLIDEATEKAGASGTALDEIVHMVDNVADQVRSIATASEEQSSTSEEINRSVSEVNIIAEQTAQAMGEAARAVSELAVQAQRLSALIEDMKKG